MDTIDATTGFGVAQHEGGLPPDMLQGRKTFDPADINHFPRPPSFQPEPSPSGDAVSLNFDDFCLLPRERLLFHCGERLRIGDRALDILIALVTRQGEIVSKSRLSEIAWPDIFVEESSLRGNILGLRRILRDGQAGRRLIVTVTGRGYVFVGRVHRGGSSCYMEVRKHETDTRPASVRTPAAHSLRTPPDQLSAAAHQTPSIR